MAVVNFTNRPKSQTRGGMRAVINYTMRESKTEYNGIQLVSGLNCSPQSVYQEFVSTKLQYGKDEGRMYYHFTQSFPPTEKISPLTAHEIALKLAEHYKDFEVLVCTHTDREHIHSHFIINSVSFETGKKLHQSANAIQELRQKSDAICREYGLSICQPKLDRQRVKGISAGEYHMATKGKSWKMQLAYVIDECMKHAVDKDNFIDLMEIEGYKVKWTDTRKNITYTTPDGKKCADDKFHEIKYLKEMMKNEFRIRQKIVIGRTEILEQTAESTANPTTSTDLLYSAERGLGTSARRNSMFERADAQSENTAKAVGDTDTGTIKQDGTERNIEERSANSDVIITGWEKERMAFFAPQTAVATGEIVTDVAFAHSDIAGIAHDVVQLGKAVERISNTPPIKGVTATPQSHNGRKKKLAVGQKEDDHSGHDFEITM